MSPPPCARVAEPNRLLAAALRCSVPSSPGPAIAEISLRRARGGSIGKCYDRKIRRGPMSRAEWELNALTILANGGRTFLGDISYHRTAMPDPAVLANAPEIFRFVEPDVFKRAAKSFGEADSITKILVVPALPAIVNGAASARQCRSRTPAWRRSQAMTKESNGRKCVSR